MFKVFASIWNPDLRVLSTHQIPVPMVNITLIRHVRNRVCDASWNKSLFVLGSIPREIKNTTENIIGHEGLCRL